MCDEHLEFKSRLGEIGKATRGSSCLNASGEKCLEVMFEGRHDLCSLRVPQHILEIHDKKKNMNMLILKPLDKFCDATKFELLLSSGVAQRVWERKSHTHTHIYTHTHRLSAVGWKKGVAQRHLFSYR